MNNPKNAIAKDSPLYDALLSAYEIPDRRLRFQTCYELVDHASYEDIHFVTAMLSEVHAITNDDFSSVLPDTFFQSLTLLLSSKPVQRASYLLDILYEGRERKRPTT